MYVERVQTGVRMEKRLVKVLKALAEYHDVSLGELLEGIVLHAFDHRTPFGAPSLELIRKLKEVYGLDYGAEASHTLRESGEQGTGNREQGTGNREQGTGNRE
ncbi:MAG TPA: hypothetical protein VGC13_31735 [Longimicrobium sp.]|jgi:hypothetical protein